MSEGAIDPGERVEVSVMLRPRRPLPDAEQLAKAAPLSRDEFAETYGADPADVAKVKEFASSTGLEVVQADAARRTVVLGGPASQVATAFGVELQRHTAEDGTSYRAPDHEPSVPPDLQDIVQGVFGLDTHPIAQPRV